MADSFDFSLAFRGGRRDGAGRPARRLRAERLRRIDVRELARCDLFLPHLRGEWWSVVSRRGSSADWFALQGMVDEQGAEIAVHGFIDGGFVVQDVALQHTRCNYGGLRPWFTCPQCERRAAVLYIVGPSLRCRRCADVSYLTQRRDACSRAWIKQWRIERRLVRTGMHQRTRHRLLEQLHECERRRDVWLVEQFAKWPFVLLAGE